MIDLLPVSCCFLLLERYKNDVLILELLLVLFAVFTRLRLLINGLLKLYGSLMFGSCSKVVECTVCLSTVDD